MMSMAARPGALSPYLRATKHTVKSLLCPRAKELVPAAGKGEDGRFASNISQSCYCTALCNDKKSIV